MRTEKTRKALLSGWFDAPFWDTRIRSANVHGKERWLGYVLGPFGVMLLQSIVNSYFNKYLTDTNTTVKALIKTARGFRNLENMKALIYLKCSDLLIPLNNRPQPSAQKHRAMRLEAAQRRRSRQEAARQPEITA